MELSITYNYIDIGQTCRLYTTILRSDMSTAYKKSQRTSNNRISCHHIMNLYCAALSIITWRSHIFPIYYRLITVTWCTHTGPYSLSCYCHMNNYIMPFSNVICLTYIVPYSTDACCTYTVSYSNVICHSYIVPYSTVTRYNYIVPYSTVT